MARACDQCASLYEPLRRTSRYCSGRCRKRAQRSGVARSAAEHDSAPRVETSHRAADQGPVTTAVLAELVDAGRHASALGQACLAVARRMDNAHGETGSALASLTRELRAALEQALAAAEDKSDALDELARRRQERLASGGH